MMMWKSAPDATKIDRTFHNGFEQNSCLIHIYTHRYGCAHGRTQTHIRTQGQERDRAL